jgi:hypothetical protein
MAKKPSGNMKRGGGEWNDEDVLGSEDPNSEIPKTGWAVVSGKSAALTTLYHNGKAVKHVRAFDYAVTAGNIPVMTLEIIAPEIKMISKGILSPKEK